jgi:hypothetical protein
MELFVEKVDEVKAHILKFITPKIANELNIRAELAQRLDSLESQQARLTARKGELEAAITDTKDQAVEAGLDGEIPRSAAGKLNRLRTDLELCEGLLERCQAEITKTQDAGSAAMLALHDAFSVAISDYRNEIQAVFEERHRALSTMHVGYSHASKLLYHQIMGQGESKFALRNPGGRTLYSSWPLVLPREAGLFSIYEVHPRFEQDTL